MKKWILPNQKINKENLLYEWVAENEACEVCKAMNGKIYNSANDIPDKPHPNCKCHIEIIEKDDYEEIKDPIEKRRKEKQDHRRALLEIKKLLGNINVNKDEINELLVRANEKKNKYLDFLKSIDKNTLEDTDIKKINDSIQTINSIIIKTKKVKSDLIKLENSTVVLEGKIEKTNIWSSAGRVLIATLNALKQTLNGLIKIINTIIEELWETSNSDVLIFNLILKNIVANTYGFMHTFFMDMPEAMNFYKIGSPELNSIKYIEKNGYLYDSISDLHNYKIEKDIHNRIYNEMGLKDCKVLVLRSDSSAAKKIENSTALKKFVKENIDYLTEGKTIYEKAVPFESVDSDMYAAVHGTVFKDVKIDENDNLCLRVEDFWNFELRFSSAKAVLGRYLQDSKRLIPYYAIINLKISKDVWKNFL